MTGEEIKQRRLELGYSQEELARKMGISYATISRWERGVFSPSNMAMEKLKKILKK